MCQWSLFKCPPFAKYEQDSMVVGSRDRCDTDMEASCHPRLRVSQEGASLLVLIRNQRLVTMTWWRRTADRWLCRIAKDLQWLS